MVGVLKTSSRQRDTAKWLKYGTLAVSDSSLPSLKGMITESDFAEETFHPRNFVPCSRSISLSYISYSCSESSKTHDCNANGIRRMKDRDECDYDYTVKQGSPSARDLPETSSDRVRSHLEAYKLSENDIRDALWDFVLHKRCYSRKPVIEMDILCIECTCVYRYIVETCVEQPQTRWITEPYDGAEGPLPPAPVQTLPSTGGRESCSTVSGYQRVSVPKSATVKVCMPCSGRGVKPCVKCICTGRARCPFCQNHNFHHDGVGHLHSSRCLHCSGFSYLPCPYCKGVGHTMCGKCNGKGKLKSYVQVKMASKSIVSDIFLPLSSDPKPEAQESLPLPSSLLKNADGVVIFEDQSLEGAVHPIAASSASAFVERVSSRVLRQHEFAYPGAKVKMQKHKLVAIPIAKVDAEYQKMPRTFHVYGRQRHVHFVDYFSKRAVCCTLM